MANAQSEPTMDEILESIRRIISDDEDPKAGRGRGEPLSLRDTDAVTEAEAAPASPAAKVAPTPGARPKPAEAPAPVSAEEEADDDGADTAAAAEEPAPPKAAPSRPAPSKPAPAAARADTGAAAGKDLLDSYEDDRTDTPHRMQDRINAAVSEALISDTALDQTREAFGHLQESVRVSQSGGRTIEDIVETMLQPLVEQWLDNNLPRIVEEKVEEEIRRIARRR